MYYYFFILLHYLLGTCNGEQVTCTPGESCTIQCPGNADCSEALLNCARDYPCTVVFGSNTINQFVIINDAEHSSLTVTSLIPLDSYNLDQSKIRCPESAACRVDMRCFDGPPCSTNQIS